MDLSESSGLVLQGRIMLPIPIFAGLRVWACHTLSKLESSDLSINDSFSLYGTSPGIMLYKLKKLMTYQCQPSFAVIHVHFLSLVLYK